MVSEHSTKSLFPHLCLGKVAIVDPIKFHKMTVPAATHLTGFFYNAEVIGNAFVAQYYHVLHHSPELAYKFYIEMSILSRPNPDGTMSSVTTLKDIDAKIQSLNFKNSMPEIETVDAQYSFYSGIIVLVTGSLTGTDDVKRKFTQTFFLAPQEMGYFVLNDVFRCVKESGQLEINSEPVDCDNDSSPTAPLATASDVPSVTLSANKVESEGKAGNLFGKEKGSEIVKENVSEESNHIGQDGSMVVNSSDSSGAEQDNRSYASIVKVPKASASGVGNLRWTPTKNSPTPGSPNLSAEPTASPPTSDIGPQISNPQKGVEGHSVYIRNLPLRATVADVIEEFTKFGPINDGGVQVKIHKEYGYCFGFVEFQSLDSMQNAIKESPLTFGGRRLLVEEKKSTIRVGSTGNTERFISGRGKFQNGSFRGRSYLAGRGYGRNEVRYNHKLMSRPRSNSGSYTEYHYQRVDRSQVGEHGSDTGDGIPEEAAASRTPGTLALAKRPSIDERDSPRSSAVENNPNCSTFIRSLICDEDGVF
ncbi:Ras GTPase-activating protein-binding protein 1 [Heracleum sosnowskyi]|uniref:Ras GTPase-activating protein-binding protein 1 n=1 Tax=Heracleum sosnowskyi TaxID=360622 RepID=A0AAD8HTT2_9APIA|nr:Ras GTPase-activating protein-binding protein 1 [Heracleum sosnowskyi]